MNSIKKRILLAFLTLCVLTSPFLVFSYLSMKKINNARVLKEQIAVFNVNRLKASNTFSYILDHDIKIDSFYLQNTYDLKNYKNYIKESKKALSLVITAEEKAKDIQQERVIRIASHLQILDDDMEEVFKLSQQRGFKDFGLIGVMRSNIHNLEVDSSDISMIDYLSIRRLEKDFFLRGDLKYVTQLNKICDSLQAKLTPLDSIHIITMGVLKSYQQSFNKIVTLENKIGNDKKGLVKKIRATSENLDKEVTKLYDVVDTNSQILTSSIKSYIILFFFITTIFAVLFAFIFSTHITKPIKRLINDMTLISENNYNGEIRKRKYEFKEINQLTNSYEELINKIRNQIDKLNFNNRKLNVLNGKLKKSEDELLDAIKVKDKFFSIISHDLRGHTGNILSLADILHKDNTDIGVKERSVFVKHLFDSSQNLMTLLDSLLSWAKSQMTEKQVTIKPFNISIVIEKNIELFTDNAYRKKVHVGYNKREIPDVYADQDMMDFVIRNLLSNALKFTSEGDTIYFDVYPKESSLEIHVKDTGVGMTPDQINKLLHANKSEESFTTKGTNNEVGTGLGFSICKDFIRKNNGQINIISELNNGSSFVFTLPTIANFKIENTKKAPLKKQP